MPKLIPMQFQQHQVNVIRDTHERAWWVAQEVCDILGLGNVAQAMGRLAADEKQLIRLEDAPPFRKPVWCINEPGLYRLIMRSRKVEAEAFQRWLAWEVLPELHRRGEYKITRESLLANMRTPTQLQHSREVGDLQSAFGGRSGPKRYFHNISLRITGHSPKEWRAIGREQGLRWEDRRRGRAVVRKLQPAGACGMSLADELVLANINETEAFAIGKESTTLFQRMLDAGYTPPELHSSPLDGLEAQLPAREE